MAACAAALIAMGVLPWVHVNSLIVDSLIGSYNSRVASMMGFSLPEFASSYSMLDLHEMGETVSELAAVAERFGVSVGQLDLAEKLAYAATAGWCVGALCCAIGMIITLVGRHRSSLFSVFGALIILAFCFCADYVISKYPLYLSAGIAIDLSIALSVAVIVITVIARIYYSVIRNSQRDEG